MSLGRVDDNGLAETEQSTSFLTLRTATGRTSNRRAEPGRVTQPAREAHRARPFRDDYDRTRDYELKDEQARWDEAQDEALRSAVERFNEHTEDVP